LVITGLRT